MERNVSALSKRRVAILFGGRSGEHDVSIQSARSVISSMNPEKFEVVPIGITHQGDWKGGKEALNMLGIGVDDEIVSGLISPETLNEIHHFSHAEPLRNNVKPLGLPMITLQSIDVVFPVLHGTYGEDGTVQGLLEMVDKPYVGAGVLASAVGMDKVMMKMAFAEAGLPQVAFTSFLRSEWEDDPDTIIQRIERQFGYPCFIKPANLGSSVGISKAKDRSTLRQGIREACRFDRKIIVEEFVPAREVEVAVLGNDYPEASVPGEIISSNEFYDYRAKYVDGKSVMQIPADLPETVKEELKQLAIKAFQAIDCSGLARVDFFVHKQSGDVLINEINTMPGFTQFSMYPKLWEETGLSYALLVEKLIELAYERYNEKARNVTKFEVD